MVAELGAGLHAGVPGVALQPLLLLAPPRAQSLSIGKNQQYTVYRTDKQTAKLTWLYGLALRLFLARTTSHDGPPFSL